MSKKFTWLHLSDLHAGMSEYRWLWPTVKSSFLDDLIRVHDKSGAWDLVVFSGDFVQKGDVKEYSQVTDILLEMWEAFRKIGFTPKLMITPGNHDIKRPSAVDPGYLLLKQWWSQKAVRDELFLKKKTVYSSTINSAFQNYVTWTKGLKRAGLPLVEHLPGILPGDLSASFKVDGLKIGVIGLNSTWLQLDGGEAKGQLSVDVRQLHAVTDDNPEAWCKENDINILVTHHPVDWLHKDSQDTWNAEIFPPNRFNVHLYGHMHESDTTIISHGGSQARCSIQSASLCGLEFYGEVIKSRSHGYSVSRLDFGQGIRVWPRVLLKLASGQWKMVSEQRLDLDQDDSFLIRIGNTSQSIDEVSVVGTSQQTVESDIPFSLLKRIQGAEDILGGIRYFLPTSAGSLNVRRVEQRICQRGLNNFRAVWIVSDWGAGSDGFVYSVQKFTSTQTRKTFRLDLGDYTGRDDFLNSFKTKYGFSLEGLCDVLADAGPSTLILDDIPAPDADSGSGQQPVSSDLEGIVEIILMYCPDLFVIMRLRQTPIQHTFTVVVLKPLDEADLRVYVLEHEAGGVRYGSAEAISAIFRHTDGVPVRIDATLRDLEIITFDQLAAVNRDLTGQELGSVDVAPALASAVAELAQAADPQKKRSFDLLKALSAFPYGEALERIKRFNGPHPLFPSHALILIQKSLVTNNSPIYAPVAGISSDIRILSVPREVRDYVRSLIKADELRDVTRKAAGLYFGSEWKTGEIKSSAVSRFKRVNASSSEIGNAMAVVLRLINEAVDQEDSSAIASALKIADSFASVLLSGDHYRSVVVLCRDVLTAVPDLDSETIEYIEFNLAKALRMIGENQTALDILSGLDVSTFSNSEKQSVLLNQSLAHQKLGNSLEAIDSASSLLRLDTKSNSALQAKAILLEERRADGDTLIPEQLRKLEIICRKRGAHVVANNLALDRVGRQRVGSRDSTNALDEVLKSAQDGKDFYNAARSIIKIAEISVAEKTMLSAKNKLTLISAYEFLLNERISSLFDRCHAVLWNVFEHSHDIENLFRLFRHSSFIWRLREDASREIGYLRKLTVHAETLIRQDIKSLNKEITYYLVRAGSALSQSAGNQIGGLDEASS